MTDPTPARPVVVRTRPELDDLLAAHRREGSRVGLVPTMGALHEGHASLLRHARISADVVVASIFVNPLQFAPNEDLHRYPRSLDADLATCAREGTDVVFVPAVREVYPEGLEGGVTLDPGPLGAGLEGAARPTHFRGVLTVVAKLFGLVRPDEAWFGEKDYQQLVLIQHLVRDLCLPVEVQGAPIVREPDGLARSSRNAYLGVTQRQLALALPRALAAGVEQAGLGAPAAGVEAAVGEHLLVAGVEPDYVAITDLGLGKAPERGPARLLAAARVGGTRLLDNCAVVLGPRSIATGSTAA